MKKNMLITPYSESRKATAKLLCLIFLLQSCAIYDKKPVSINEVTDEKKVKVITLDNRESIYQKIFYKDDGRLYGLTSKRVKDTLNIKIPTEQIDEIKSGYDPNISKDLIITTDGRTYGFDYYYQGNDTIYGRMNIKRQKEVLLVEEDIKSIYAYNPKKSTTGTVFLTAGSAATGLLLFMVLTLATDCWGDGCFQEW